MLMPSNLLISNFDIDMSGLMGEGGSKSSKIVIHDLVNIGTDEMRFEPIFATTGEHKNRLKFNNNKVHPIPYLSFIEEGFNDCYSVFLENKDEFLKIANNNPIFEGEYRQVLRPTQIYCNFLESSYHPRYLKSLDERERLFNLLNGSNSTKNERVFAEVEALMNDDVPYFSNEFDSTTVIANNNRRIPNFYKNTIKEMFINRISNISESKKNTQLKYIRMSLCTNEKEHKQFDLNMDLNLDDRKADYLYLAKKVADDIIDNLIWNSDKSMCTILMPLIFKDYEYKLGPINQNLYEGGGIVLFFACLAEETGELKYRKIAEAMLKGIEDVYLKVNPMIGIGVFSGNMMYLYYNLYLLWKDETLYKKFTEEVDKLLDNDITEEKLDLDVVGVLSGIIISCVNIYNQSNYEPVLKLARRYGELLYKDLKDNDKELLTGFAHGCAGYSLALIKLGELDKEFKYVNLGEKLIKLEDSSYYEKENNWIDLRKKDKTCLFYWCHGGAGIGLARSLINKNIISENASDLVCTDINNSVTYFMSSNIAFNHCICHGEAGNIESFLNISENIGNMMLKEIVYKKADTLYEDIRNNGFKYDCSNLYGSVGFMLGTSGVGYLFLRLVNPKYPSVLSLDVLR